MIKKISIFAISFYQYFSPFFGQKCRYYPSCSEYARQIYFFDNPFIATLKVIKRILSCNQFFSGGVAYPRTILKMQPFFKKPCAIKSWLVPIKSLKIRFQVPRKYNLNSQIYCYVIKNI